MRLHYPNATRPKKAAQRLSKLFPNKSLHHCQQAVATAIGYRDWYELEREHAMQRPSDLDHGLAPNALEERIRVLSLRLAQALQVPANDIQMVLPQLRLTGDPASTLDEHMAWTRSMREKLGPPARHKTGSVVRVKGRKDLTGYLCKFGQPSTILTDTSFGIAADFEVVTPRAPLPDFVPLRFWLPYGYWTLSDGSEVIFSRDYLPLWRVSERSFERLPPWLWIDEKVEHTWFKDEGVGNWSAPHVVAAARERLDRFKITKLPRLVDALPYVFEFGLGGAAVAARKMLEDHRDEAVPDGPFRIRLAPSESEL